MEHNSQPWLRLADTIDKNVRRIGLGAAWLYVLLVLVIILQVILRKGFSHGLIVLEELQWHLYALGVMFGLSYAQTNNSHVRVDLFYSHFRPRTKRIVDILGILFLAMPFVIVVFLHSLDFVADSWRINEHSASPSGLPWRWFIKASIPLTFGLLTLSLLARLMRDVSLLIAPQHAQEPQHIAQEPQHIAQEPQPFIQEPTHGS